MLQSGSGLLPAQRQGKDGQRQIDYGAIMTLAGPLILGSAVQALMALTDTWFVGQISSEALAGMNAAFLPSAALLRFFVASGQAVQTLVAQSYAAGQGRDAARLCWTGIWLAMAVIPVCLGLSALGPYLYGWLELPDAVARQAIAYWQPRMLGGAAMLAVAALSGFFNGIGRTWVTFVVSGSSVFWNVLLNWGLIHFFGLGIAGAAWGTVLSEWAQVVVFLALFLARPLRQRFASTQQWRIRWSETRTLLRLGIPMGIYALTDIGSFALFQLMIAGVGEVAGAATHICLTLSTLAYMPAIGLGQAGAVLVGQAIGGGDRGWALRVGNATVKLTIVFMTSLGVVLFLWREPLMLFFVPAADPQAAEVVALGGILLQLVAVSFGCDALGISCAGALRGAGDVRVPTLILAAACWGVFLPLTHLLVFSSGQGWIPDLPGLGWGAVGGWLSELVYVTVIGFALASRWWSGHWQRIVL